MTYLLAIESSCDDTSVAVLQDDKILSNIVITQTDHMKYGGVVPEVASRQHHVNIGIAVEQSLNLAKISKDELNAIAVTQGPGLLGSLLVGVSYAKGLALALDLPLIGVHHMHAHILAHFIDDPKPEFPFLCLTVSGGHTQLVMVRSPLNMEVIGQTIDDAAGEAFDKAGKMLGLPYPAGPVIDKLAQNGQPKFSFSIAQIPGYDFSFSGFKTSVLYFLQKEQKKNPQFIQENLNDLCASVQHTIIKTLTTKLLKVLKENTIKHVAIAGGVAANSGLRSRLKELSVKHKFKIFIPRLQYCTDNAAMIGIAGYFKYKAGKFADQSMAADARLEF
jgi:N6-L-threonylcarbamoyladenine synthase